MLIVTNEMRERGQDKKIRIENTYEFIKRRLDESRIKEKEEKEDN